LNRKGWTRILFRLFRVQGFQQWGMGNGEWGMTDFGRAG
jgi:hypothetical protein